MTTRIILDTDIGDDVDDAYALAFALGSPEIELAGVTTVFGNTPARARQAQTILKVAGREDVPVAAGCGAVLSPRVDYRESDLASGQVSLGASSEKLLGDIRPRQDVSALPAEELPAPSALHGVDFLIEAVMSGAGDITLVTIGAMTNLALALVKEPRIAAKIPRIVSMAACFDRQQSEWNVRCDPVAAAIVFNSRVPMTVVGLDVTTKCVLTQGELDRLFSCDRPVARNLARATRAWGGRFPTLHDPLAVETLVRPDLVTTARGTVTVELSGGSTYGYTVFKKDKENDKEKDKNKKSEAGPHEVCFSVRPDEAKALWLERVLAL